MAGNREYSREIASKIRKAAFMMDKIAERILQKSLDLTMSQFRVLVILNAHDGVSQKALARFLGLTQAAISRQTEILRAKGLVTRAENPTCRREHVLALTAEGKRQFGVGSSILDRTFDDLLEGIGQEEEEDLNRSLDGLLNALGPHH
jgi:DNA-binding MarR family transcriptional regulator